MSAPYQLFDVLPAHIADALRASIERFGVLVPVVRDQHGNTIDGHHRARIADSLGVEYRVDVVQVANEEEAREVARTLNSDRRHLTEDQRREVVRALREQGHSVRAIAAALGVGKSTVGNDIAGLSTVGQLASPERVMRQGGGSYPARRPESVPAPEPEPEPEPLPASEPATDTVTCEACGAVLPEDQAKAGYLRCDECDSEGDHYSENFPNGPGRCVMCHGRPEDQAEPETLPAAEPEPAPEPQWTDEELALRAELEFEHNPASPDSPQLALFDVGTEIPAGARRFPYIPRLRFADDRGPHRLMLRDWGVYELMRKHNNLTQLSDTQRRRYVGEALHLDPSCSLLVGNLNNQRTAWLVISVLRGLRAAPSLFDAMETAA